MVGSPSARDGSVCDANGIRIHYLRTAGETGAAARPPVVLLHGLLGSGATWLPVARALAGEHDVIMPDARGHGGSSTPPHGYRYDDLADDVSALVRSLALQGPVLVGHSMGGMTAAVVASRRTPPLRGLVLVDPTFLSPERQREVHASDVAEQHRRLLALPRSHVLADLRARHPHRSAELVELLADARLGTRLEPFAVLAPPNPDYRELVRAIDVPTLLVLGDSPVVSLEAAAELRTLNPRVQVAQIERAGHGIPFDQPGRLAELVLAFLRELP